jgi:hypothetical protein
MKVTISNKQIIIIILIACFCALAYVIYKIPINESMSTKDKLKKRKELRSETKKIENTSMPEIHVSLADMNAQVGQPELNNEKVKIVDKYGNIRYVVISKTFGNPTYYKPGRYRYATANYVPTYEDSIFLSRSLNKYSKFEGNNNETSSNKIDNHFAFDHTSYINNNSPYKPIYVDDQIYNKTLNNYSIFTNEKRDKKSHCLNSKSDNDSKPDGESKSDGDSKSDSESKEDKIKNKKQEIKNKFNRNRNKL